MTTEPRNAKADQQRLLLITMSPDPGRCAAQLLDMAEWWVQEAERLKEENDSLESELAAVADKELFKQGEKLVAAAQRLEVQLATARKRIEELEGEVSHLNKDLREVLNHRSYLSQKPQ